MSSHYRWQGDDLLIYCHLQPKASRSEVAGLHGERLKLRIQAPPVDGKANAELCRFLAEAFAVSKSAVSLESGHTGRQKCVRIQAPVQLPDGWLIDPAR